LPYNSNFHKIQEDKSRKKEGETPSETAQKELLEETGLFVHLEDCLEIRKSRKVLSGKIPDSIHTKYFFLI
jgi:8-oxo-dGTP pyrophosphatase MutT (NUDIX family)